MVANHLQHFVPRSLLPDKEFFARKLILAHLELYFGLLASLGDDVVPVTFLDYMLGLAFQVMVGNFVIAHVYWVVIVSEFVENGLRSF